MVYELFFGEVSSTDYKDFLHLVFPKDYPTVHIPVLLEQLRISYEKVRATENLDLSFVPALFSQYGEPSYFVENCTPNNVIFISKK